MWLSLAGLLMNINLLADIGLPMHIESSVDMKVNLAIFLMDI